MLSRPVPGQAHPRAPAAGGQNRNLIRLRTLSLGALWLPYFPAAQPFDETRDLRARLDTTPRQFSVGDEADMAAAGTKLLFHHTCASHLVIHRPSSREGHRGSVAPQKPDQMPERCS